MQLFKKSVYYLRVVLFILQFLLLYSMISTLLQVKPLIYFFFFFHLLYVIRIFYEMISKKEKYKYNFIYNLMQIGLAFYIFLLFYRVRFSHVFYMKETMQYFNINLGILSVLMLFLLIYSRLELDDET